jgi:hypothetical protein
VPNGIAKAVPKPLEPYRARVRAKKRDKKQLFAISFLIAVRAYD